MSAPIYKNAVLSECADGQELGHDRVACPVCDVYRYSLYRIWEVTAGLVSWIMLNPSTADATQDDPTIRRCVGFARAWGYGGITVHNLFALRSSDPQALRRHADPVGPDNDRWLTGERTAVTVAAWGTHGAYLRRDQAVRQLLAAHALPLLHLGLTKDGAPRHPLYVPADVVPGVLGTPS